MPKLIKPDGETQILPDTITFSDIQKLVGGYVETIPCLTRDTMCINEGGKLQDLPVNPQATAIAYLFENDFIAGNAIILTPEETQKILN